MIMTMDIGGTKTLYTFWEDGRPLEKRRIPTASIRDFNRLVQELTSGRALECLCIAAAGPVRGSTLDLTGMGLRIELDVLKQILPKIQMCIRDRPGPGIQTVPYTGKNAGKPFGENGRQNLRSEGRYLPL